ncbi:hypothetical protein GCM10027053_27940 [Intrasporangium mesophilum]
MTLSQQRFPPRLASWWRVFAYSRRLTVAAALVAAGTMLTVAIDEVLLPIGMHAIPTGYVLAGAYGIAAATSGQRTLAAYERLAPLSRQVALEAATLGVTGALLVVACAVTGDAPGLTAAMAFGGLGLLAAQVVPAYAEMAVATFAVLFLYLLGARGGDVVAAFARRADVSIALALAFLVCRYAHLLTRRARPVSDF